MTENNNKENSIIPISSTDLVRVGNSIEITNKIIKEHEHRIVISNFETIKTGNQEWMKVNLDLDCYSNGDPIPQVTNPEEWAKLKSGAWCYYDNDINNKHMGKLYNMFAVIDPRGLAPIGWHVPSDAEWTTLENNLGGSTVAGSSMKEIGNTNWLSDNTDATNSSGFTAIPCGYRDQDGTFKFIGKYAFWWSSTENKNKEGWYRSLNSIDGVVFKEDHAYAGHGLSVRCLKD